MYVDLDESALTNNIDSKNGVPNHGCVTENVRNYEGNCASNLFALRTIHAGEELVWTMVLTWSFHHAWNVYHGCSNVYSSSSSEMLCCDIGCI